MLRRRGPFSVSRILAKTVKVQKPVSGHAGLTFCDAALKSDDALAETRLKKSYPGPV